MRRENVPRPGRWRVRLHTALNSSAYTGVMLGLILLSVVPLFFHRTITLFTALELVTCVCFILDYLARWLTADLELGRSGFLRYPITPFAILDMLSILPSLGVLGKGFRLAKLLRMGKLMRAARIGKAFRSLRILRYSRSVRIIVDVIRRERRSLLAVCVLAGGYIVLSALIMFQVEPESFPVFGDALYWAAITLTTVGYGDIYPVTNIGRIVGVISSLMGIAIVALPTGIVTAGYTTAIHEGQENEAPAPKQERAAERK